MTTILCYGDSLTWGSDPGKPGIRHGAAHRWPDVMAAELGSGFRVIADGMRGRTTAYDEHLADCDRNGVRLLPSALYVQAPVDIVVLMLGVNDLKPHIAGTAMAAKQGMRRLVQIVHGHAQGLVTGHRAKALIVAPPKVIETENDEMAAMFAGAPEEAAHVAGHYAELAAEKGAAFFDAGRIAEASPLDGVHLDAENTAKIGRALAPVVRAMAES